MSRSDPSTVAARRVVPQWVRALLGLTAIPTLLVLLGAAGLMPADVLMSTWSTQAQLQTWTSGGNPGLGTQYCATGDTYCYFESATGGGDGHLTSPSLLENAGTYYLLVDGPTSTTLKVSGDTTTYTGSAVAGGTKLGPFPVSTAQGQALVLTLYVPGSNGVGNFRLFQATAPAAPTATPGGPGGGSTGSVTYPVLDMTALAAQVAAFWGFIAPAVYIIGGISLGGLIVAKFRHLI